MSDRTDPQIELHDGPTRIADIREMERQLVASAERDDDTFHAPVASHAAADAQPPREPDDDDFVTKLVELPSPPQRTARFPVATVITGAPKRRFPVGLAVAGGVGGVLAINAALLLALYVDDGPIPEAPVAAAPAAASDAPATATAPIEPIVPAPAAPVTEVGSSDTDLAVEPAPEAPVDPASVDRLRARAMVLGGDGAVAVAELREMTTTYPDDASIALALARVLAQAEEDTEAGSAFDRVLELDAQNVDAHVGLARLTTRAARLPRAREHLAAAREAYERGDSDPVLEARLSVTEGIIVFELGDYAEASRHAERALELDDQSAEAHLLLGRIAIERDEDAAPHLRAAVAGRAPPAEALGMLVPRAGDDSCELAERYLLIAPRGYDAPVVRRAQRRCR